jgi:DNA-binding transcriptional ArsR family regulator
MGALAESELPPEMYGRLSRSARKASRFLKALANENRLMLLCVLSEGEYSVTELEEILGMRQPAISQQLARLREDKLVVTRRDGKLIYYSLASEEARDVMQVIYRHFCSTA